MELHTGKKKKHKRKAKGEIISAINKNIKGVEVKEINEEAVESKMEYNGNKWRIITLYSRKIEDTMEIVMEKIPEEEEECLIMGGDFNTRTWRRRMTDKGRRIRRGEGRDKKISR